MMIFFCERFGSDISMRIINKKTSNEPSNAECYDVPPPQLQGRELPSALATSTLPACTLRSDDKYLPLKLLGGGRGGAMMAEGGGGSFLCSFPIIVPFLLWLS